MVTKWDILFTKSKYMPPHAPKGGITIEGKDFKGGELIPPEAMAQATDEQKARIEGDKGGDSEGGKKKPPEPEPEEEVADEWDGTIDEDEVEESDEDDWEEIGTYSKWDDGEEQTFTVRLAHGVYTTPQGEDIDVYRWQALDSDGDVIEQGNEWETDKELETKVGKAHASSEHEEPPEPEDGDIPNDVDGLSWGDRDVIENYTNEGAEYTVRLDVGEFEFGGQTHTCYRWTTRRHEDGEWTLDRRQAVRDGEEYAASMHEEEEDEDPEELYNDFFDGDVPDPLELFGALEGSTYRFVMHDGHPQVEISHPKYDGTQDRTLMRDSSGKRYIKNDYFKIKEEYRSEGLGEKVFAAQVKACAAAGIAYIKTHAAGPPNNPSMNGFYTWASFGYDQPIDHPSSSQNAGVRAVFGKVRELFPDAKSVLDIMATPRVELSPEEFAATVAKLDAIDEETKKPKKKRDFITGAEWWKANGAEMYSAKFDLDPNSRSMAVLNARVEATRRKQSKVETKSISHPNKKKSATWFGRKSIRTDSSSKVDPLTQFLESSTRFMKAVRHAPKGGITLAGEFFHGGQFIPDDAFDRATSEEKASFDKSQSKATKKHPIEDAFDDKPHLPPHDEKLHGEFDSEKIAKEFEQKANEQGLDASELHKKARENIIEKLQRKYKFDENRKFLPINEQIAELEENIKSTKKLIDDGRTGLTALKEEYEQQLAQLKDAGKNGLPDFAKVNRTALVTSAYDIALTELEQEKTEKQAAEEFADSYFEEDDAETRARNYMSELADNSDFNPEHLPEDIKNAIAEDLATLNPEDLAKHVVYAFEQHGAELAAGEIAREAAEQKAQEIADAGSKEDIDLDYSDTDDISMLTVDNHNEDQWEAIKLVAQLLPTGKAMWLDKDRAILAEDGSEFMNVVSEIAESSSPNTPEEISQLFDNLRSSFQLSQGDVPASARDYGGTSGSKGTGEFNPESEWNPNAVDVYRRLNEDWYIMQRSHANEDDDAYEFVRASDVPPLSRLPQKYWDNLMLREDGGADDDLVEQAAKREENRSEEGRERKLSIKEHKNNIRDMQKRIRQLRNEWNKALAGVDEEDRPDEPDWDAIDMDALTDAYDSREEHADALDTLHSELSDHADELEQAIEEAKEHAEDHHRKHKEEADSYVDQFQQYEKESATHLKTLADALTVTAADEDINADLNDIETEPMPEFETDDDDAREVIENAYNLIGESNDWPHEDSPDPDAFDADEDELFGEDEDETPRERAERYAEAFNDWKETRDELVNKVQQFAESVKTRSSEWRTSQMERLQTMQEAIDDAIDLGAERIGDDGEMVIADLTNIKAKVTAAMGKIQNTFRKSMKTVPEIYFKSLSAATPMGKKRVRTNPIYHELTEVAINHFLKSHHEGKDPTDGINRLMELWDDPEQAELIARGEFHKATDWKEELHPRDKNGRFISKELINEAKGNAKVAAELRGRVRDEDKGKLESAIEGKTDLGRTKAGLKKDEATKRKQDKVLVRDNARAVRDRLMNQQNRGEELDKNDLRELIDHLPKLTLEEIGKIRSFLNRSGASFGGAKKRAERIQRLTEWAQGNIDTPAESSEPQADKTAADYPERPEGLLAGEGLLASESRANMTKDHLSDQMAKNGGLTKEQAEAFADNRTMTESQSEAWLQKLGMSRTEAKQALSKLNPVGTRTVSGNRKKPTYSTADIFRAAGKLIEPSTAKPEAKPQADDFANPAIAEPVAEAKPAVSEKPASKPEERSHDDVLNELVNVANDPQKLKAEAERIAAMANQRGGSLAYHDALRAAMRGELGDDVKQAVDRAFDDWGSHGGQTAKRYARAAEEIAKIRGSKQQTGTKPAPTTASETTNSSGKVYRDEKANEAIADVQSKIAIVQDELAKDPESRHWQKQLQLGNAKLDSIRRKAEAMEDTHEAVPEDDREKLIAYAKEQRAEADEHFKKHNIANRTKFVGTEHLENQRKAELRANAAIERVNRMANKPVASEPVAKPTEDYDPNLPEATPGKLFDAGEDKPRSQFVSGTDNIAKMARMKVPGVFIQHPGASAPLAEHISSLAAIDKHIGEKFGVKSNYFDKIAETLKALEKDNKNGHISTDELREVAESFGTGDYLDSVPDRNLTHWNQVAQELRDRGEDEAARFYERQGAKVEDIVKDYLMELAGPELPDKEPHEKTKVEYDYDVRYSSPLPEPEKNSKGFIHFTPAAAKKFIEENKREGYVYETRVDYDHNGRKTNKLRVYAFPTHKQIVKEAVEAGKTVPPEVLADYPDLVSKQTDQFANPEIAPTTASEPVAEQSPSAVDEPKAEPAAGVKEFLDNYSPTARGNAERILSNRVIHNGKEMTTAEFIEDLVSRGGKPGKVNIKSSRKINGERKEFEREANAIKFDNGSYYEVGTASEADYAKHLAEGGEKFSEYQNRRKGEIESQEQSKAAESERIENERQLKESTKFAQQTLSKYMDKANKDIQSSYTDFAPDRASRLRERDTELAKARHKEHVQNVLDSGGEVPPEVLADYPDLAAKYGKQKQPAATAPQADEFTNAELAPQAESKPAAGDYSKWDAILRTAGNREQAEKIARATGVAIRPATSAPTKGEYAKWLRSLAGNDAGMSEAESAVKGSAVDRKELLDAVREVYGDDVHGQVKGKSKQGIWDGIRNAKPKEQAANDDKKAEPEPAADEPKATTRAKFNITPQQPMIGDGGGAIPKTVLGPDRQVIEGEIAGLPVTTSERNLIQKVSPKTVAAMEELLSDQEVLASMKDAGITHIHVTPKSGSGKPKSWTMAHSNGGLFIHPKTAEEAKNTDSEARKNRGLSGVVHHEAGHAYWDKADNVKKKAFSDALDANPEVASHVAAIVNVKPPSDAFDYNEKERLVSEVHAEVQAMRKYDKDAYEKLPKSVRDAAENISPSKPAASPDLAAKYGKPPTASTPAADEFVNTELAEAKPSAGVESAEEFSSEPPAKDNPATVADFGEVISGARKHMIGTPRQMTDAQKQKQAETTSKPAWMRPYQIHKDTRGKFFVTHGAKGPYGSSQMITSGGKVKDFDTAEEAEKAIPLHAVANKHGVKKVTGSDGTEEYAIYRKVTDRKSPVVKSGFKTYEEATKHMAANPESILNHKFPDWEDYSYLASVDRVGPKRADGNVTTSDFQNAFKFRGGQFGNWQTNRDGQQSLNHAYDALHDLSDVTGLTPEQLSLGGKLAIAFGARGTGGKHAAKAHYEPDQAVINLTKMSGAGSLGHEWFHALDHALAKIEHGENTKELLTSNLPYNDGKNSDVVKAFKNLVNTMTFKQDKFNLSTESEQKKADAKTREVNETIDRLIQRHRDDATYNKRHKPFTPEQQAKWDNAINRLRSGDYGAIKYVGKDMSAIGLYEPIAELNDIYKQSTGRSLSAGGADSFANRMQYSIKRKQDADKRLEAAKAGGSETKKVRTNFYESAAELDKTSTGDYYTLPHEMAARAFAAYIQDKLAEKSRKSDYLAAKTHNSHFAGVDAKPYPEGDERNAINEAMDKLFEAVKKHYNKT